MPNWVFNTLSVTGEQADLTRLMEQVNAPFTHTYEDGKVQEYPAPIFALWNIVRPTEAEMEDYNKQGWYDWNIAHWGTKWDTAYSEGGYRATSIEEQGDDFILYRFDTAWSPPLDAIHILAEQHPDLHFELEYEEEQGWGGVVDWSEGVVASVKEWDIPSSHADYEELDRECNCQNDGDPRYWFEDCPEMEFYEEIDGEFVRIGD